MRWGFVRFSSFQLNIEIRRLHLSVVTWWIWAVRFASNTSVARGWDYVCNPGCENVFKKLLSKFYPILTYHSWSISYIVRTYVTTALDKASLKPSEFSNLINRFLSAYETYWTTRVRFPERTMDCSLFHSAQIGSGAHPICYPMGAEGSLHWGKAAGGLSWPLTSI
jgi:hypothetical protein